MNRPTHIAALDRALLDAIRRVDDADTEVAEFLDAHIHVINAYKRVLNRRAEAYSDVRSTEDAIRSLQYVVLDADGQVVPKSESVIEGRTYSASDDERAAVERAEAVSHD